MPTATSTTLQLDKASALLTALAEPTRLRLLSLIAHNGELCVCDLIDVTGLPQTRVSRHLAALRHAGWVQDRREGLWVHYSLQKPESQTHKRLVMLLKQAHEEVEQLAADLKALRKMSCCTIS